MSSLKNFIKIKIFIEEGFIESMRVVKNYLIFQLCRVFLSREGLLLKKIHGNKMYLDLSYPGISRTLAIFGTREKLETEIFKKELKKGMAVLDIGANIGYYTLIAASIVKNKGRVYAFEPEPRNFEILKKNIAENNYSSIVTAYPFAVSNKEGVAKLYISRKSNLHTLVRPKTLHKELKVKAIKIDNFLKDKLKIDFIRMDIEGCECMVIDGMLKTLEETNPPLKLLIEVHPYLYNEGDLNFKLRLKKLSAIGFKAKYIISAEVARPQKIIERGYEPIFFLKEGGFSRGLYKNIAMEDLLEFVHSRPKIVRDILLEKQQ